MAEQILKDRNGTRIGTIEEMFNGRLVAKDRSGQRVGEYDPQTNLTIDRNGSRVGQGNLLSTLVGEVSK